MNYKGNEKINGMKMREYNIEICEMELQWCLEGKFQLYMHLLEKKQGLINNLGFQFEKLEKKS